MSSPFFIVGEMKYDVVIMEMEQVVVVVII